MSNLAIRKSFLILIEKIARLESYYREKINTDCCSNSDLLNIFQKSIDKIKEEISSNRNILLNSYENKQLAENDIQKAMNSLRKCVKDFLELHKLLSHLNTNCLNPEIFIFLDKELAELNNISQIDSRIVLLSNDYLFESGKQLSLPYLSSKEIPHMLFLPVMENSNPLYWLSFVKNILSNTDKSGIDIDSVISEITDKIYDEKIKNIVRKISYEMFSDILTLKIIGPAYYNFFTEYSLFNISAGLTENAQSLIMREEILWGEIIRNSINIDSYNNLRYLNRLRKLPESLASELGFDSDLSDLLCILSSIAEKINDEADRIIDKNSLFNQNDIQNSLSACERLKEGVFISSSNTFSIEEARDSYEKAYNADVFNIYEHLNRLKEMPCSPKQIINAGWIYKEATLDSLFEEMLNTGIDFDLLGSYFKNLDDLLTKSIEISQIHRILLGEKS